MAQESFFNRVGDTLFDIFLAPHYYVAHGEGLSTARENNTVGQGRRQRAAGDVQGFQGNLAQTQLVRAAELQQELDTQGRPIMDAQVLRQQEIADLAAQYAKEGIPEAQRQMAADDIQRSQAMQLSAASNLGTGLRALGNTQASTAQAYRELAAQDAAMAQQNQAQYLRSLGSLGAAEGVAEQYNQLMPYQEKQAEMQALLGSSTNNQMAQLQFGYQNAAQTEQMMLDLASTAAQIGAQASDRRLKQNINKVGVSESGIPIYTWNYKTTPHQTHTGTIAQDLIELGRKDAIVTMEDGYYAVDYSKIDVEFSKVK